MTTEKKSEGLTRPKSAYILFCNAKRPQIKEENDGISPKKTLELLGEAWRIAKENGDDKEFVKLAEEEKAKFQKAKDNGEVVAETKTKKKSSKKVVETDEEKPKEEKSKEKKAKADKKPKTKKTVEDGSDKPVGENKKVKLNGYIKYLQAKRDGCKTENPSYTSKQITKALADSWNGLTDDVKLEWKNKE